MSQSGRDAYENAIEAYCEEFYARNLLVMYDADDAWNDWLEAEAEKEKKEIAKVSPDPEITKTTRRI